MGSGHRGPIAWTIVIGIADHPGRSPVTSQADGRATAVSAWIGMAAASMLAWIVLLVGRGFFWRVSPCLEPLSGSAEARASVAAIIPARDEADVLPKTLPTVLEQDYRGPLEVVVVDDRSADRTADVAASTAAKHGAADRVRVVSGAPLPAGWRGKVWAMHQGVGAASGQVDYFWFTDADIAHDKWVLGALVDRAETDRRDLVSTMAKLRAESRWDRLLIPAFVYFFAKLYPFRFVASSKRRTAGAAGGCVLVQREALERVGGIESIRSALIDDCALGRTIKRSGGRLWLGFSRGVRSTRGYGSLTSVWEMVARSAYTQLGHSPLMLLGTVVGMLLLYLLPPCICIAGAIAFVFAVPGATWLIALGGTTWTLMALSFLPIVRHHEVPPWVCRLLPLAGVLYTAMTVSSAWRHRTGRGGAWKGRTYSPDR